MHINAHSQLLNGWKPPIVAYLTNKKIYSGSLLRVWCYYYLFMTWHTKCTWIARMYGHIKRQAGEREYR